jgi:hypothetical protein
MELKAINDIIYGAQIFRAGEVFTVDEDTAAFFMRMKWVEQVDEPKTAKKTKKK